MHSITDSGFQSDLLEKKERPLPLFNVVEHLLNTGNFQAAITQLLSLFTVVTTEEEIMQCYTLLFRLFPHFGSLDSLLNNIPHLLARSSLLSEYQQELAIQIGTYYQNHHQNTDAMHAFAKAIQIHDDKKAHRAASKYFATLLQHRLEKFLTNAYPSFEAIRLSLEQIETFKTFCLDLQDILPFYTKVLERINNIGFEKQEAVDKFRSEILNSQANFKEPLLLATERYRNALDSFRDSFSFSLGDVRAFQRHVVLKFKEMFQVFLDDIFILIGAAPCAYDIRVMGSLGREEVCPFSDLEFFILISDSAHKPFFKKLFEILEIQIASLGETARFNFWFTCLERPNPSGLRIDISPTEDRIHIGTPEDMAKLQEDCVIGPQEFAYMSLKTSSLAQNTPDLFVQFKELVKAHSSLPNRVYVALETRQQDYRLQTKIPPNFQTGVFNIKEQFVEIFNHLLSDIALYYGILQTNTIEIIAALVEQGCFTEKTGQLLQECVASIYALRIGMHLHYGQQKESASCTADLKLYTLASKEIALLEKIWWLVFYPLYNCVDTIIKKNEDFREAFQNIDLIEGVTNKSVYLASLPLIRQIAHYHCDTNDVAASCKYFETIYKLQDPSLAVCYFKTVEERGVIDILQSLIEIPNQSGLRLSFGIGFNKLVQAIFAITDEFPEGEEMVVITTGIFEKPRYLKRTLFENILEGVDLCDAYKGSAHRVCRLQYEGFDIHLKQKPSQALMEYAIHNLNGRIAGQLTPTTLLVRFDVETSNGKKSYPVLFSQTIQGENLKNVWQEVEANANYTWTLLTTILTRPGDGRLSNYVLDHQHNLYCVDNDISFVEPVIRETLAIYRTVNFCSAPFAILPLDTPLDAETLRQFCALDSHAILDAWIDDVIEREKEYAKLFTEEECKTLFEEDADKSFTPTILFREGALATLYLQFWQLQNAISSSLMENKILTSGELLEMLISLRREKIGAYIFKSYNNGQATPEQRLQTATYRNQQQSMTSVQCHKACLGGIPSIEEIQGARRYSPENAKKEFLFMFLQRNSKYVVVTSDAQENSIQANFEELQDDRSRQLLVLKALIFQAEIQKPNSIVIHHSNMLNANHLWSLLHPGVVLLDIRYCTSIGDDAVPYIASATQLKELFLSGTNITAFQGSILYRRLHFPNLSTFKLDHCPNLYIANVYTPKIQVFTAKHNPELKFLYIKSPPLFQVDSTGSEQVQITHSTIEWRNTVKGHTRRINALLPLLGDDGTVLSASSDGTLKIWNHNTGYCTKTLQNLQNGHSSWVNALCLLPHGIVATGSWDKTIKLWNLEKEECVRTLEGHAACINALITLADGTLVSSSDDFTIKHWNPQTGECLMTFEGHARYVNALVQISNKILASGSYDKTIKFWNIETGACLKTLEGHTACVNALVLLSNGHLASASWDKTIKIWDIEAEECVYTLEGHEESVKTLIQLPDGTLASGSDDHMIKLWDLKTGNCFNTLQRHRDFVTALIQLADGTLASGSCDNTIKFWA